MSESPDGDPIWPFVLAASVLLAGIIGGILIFGGSPGSDDSGVTTTTTAEPEGSPSTTTTEKEPVLVIEPTETTTTTTAPFTATPVHAGSVSADISVDQNGRRYAGGRIDQAWVNVEYEANWSYPDYDHAKVIIASVNGTVGKNITAYSTMDSSVSGVGRYAILNDEIVDSMLSSHERSSSDDDGTVTVAVVVGVYDENGGFIDWDIAYEKVSVSLYSDTRDGSKTGTGTMTTTTETGPSVNVTVESNPGAE